MVIQVTQIKNKRKNFFMTDQEVKTLWQHVCTRYSLKYVVMLGLLLFRGLRVGEVTAMSMYDFTNSKFQKVNIILQKSHVMDNFPLLKDFDLLLKEYIQKNRHMMKNGYLFPFYSKKRYKHEHIDTKTVDAWFSKVRKKIGQEHPDFLERYYYQDKTGRKGRGGGAWRYRISPHSCRRWFETKLWAKFKDKMLLRDVMRYLDSSTVDVYIDPYEVWTKENEILNATFGEFWQDCNLIQKGQTKLTQF